MQSLNEVETQIVQPQNMIETQTAQPQNMIETQTAQPVKKVETQTVQPKKSKRPLILILVALVAIVAVFGGLYAYNYYLGPCGVNHVKEATDKMQGIAGRWDDAVQLASSTSRIALSGPVSTLQGIQREAESLEMPKCLAGAHDALTSSMSSTVDGFVAFLGQEPDSTVTTHLTKASTYLDSFVIELSKVAACAPNCP